MKKKRHKYKYSYESDDQMGNSEEENGEKKNEKTSHDPKMFFNTTQHSE
ncbi:hypothetical protein [Bacillus sp. FJAT-47783]|nr:hypothetical protein [Bacillus sp. FJAT-47783]